MAKFQVGDQITPSQQEVDDTVGITFGKAYTVKDCTASLVTFDDDDDDERLRDPDEYTLVDDKLQTFQLGDTVKIIDRTIFTQYGRQDIGKIGRISLVGQAEGHKDHYEVDISRKGWYHARDLELVNYKQEFQVGDRVRLIKQGGSGCSNRFGIGTEFIVKKIDRLGMDVNAMGVSGQAVGYERFEYFEKIVAEEDQDSGAKAWDIEETNDTVKEKETMSATNELKQLALSEDERLLRKYLVVDDRGNLQSDGRDMLEYILFEDNKEKIVAKLKEIEAAKEAATKKSSK